MGGHPPTGVLPPLTPKSSPVRQLSAKTLTKYEKAKEQLARGRKKKNVARDLGYQDFRALTKMMHKVER
jgi:hypothetical protein